MFQMKLPSGLQLKLLNDNCNSWIIKLKSGMVPLKLLYGSADTLGWFSLHVWMVASAETLGSSRMNF